MKNRMTIIASILVTITVFAMTFAFAGEMFKSDLNNGLAINALLGARQDAQVGLSSICATTNPDCTWSFRDGMIISDRNPALALNASGGARDGADIKLSNICARNNPDCTWTFTRGVLLSDRNPQLAIITSNGAQNLSPLKLSAACSANNVACRWTISDPLIRVVVPPTRPPTEPCTLGGPKARCICDCSSRDDPITKQNCLAQCPIK